VERATGARPEAFLVQRMLPRGHRAERRRSWANPDFGPVVACGAGGRTVELLGDVAVRLAPFGARAAHDMLRSLRTFPLLDGYRGAPPADTAGVEDFRLRVRAGRREPRDRRAWLQPADRRPPTARS
jgi:acetate---CoA ligase (ADP-forming)